MTDNRLPQQLLYRELYQGKRSVGGQKKRFKDCLKTSLKDLDIDINTWETLALDHPTWRSRNTAGVRAAETRQRKRAVRKAWASSTSTAVPGLMCPTCGRAFRTRIGFTNSLAWPTVLNDQSEIEVVVIFDSEEWPSSQTTTTKTTKSLVELAAARDSSCCKVRRKNF